MFDLGKCQCQVKLIKSSLNLVCFFMQLYNIYSCFFITPTCSILLAFICENQNLEFWGSIGKISKRFRSPFCRAFNYTFLSVSGLQFASNLYILEAFKHVPLFDKKRPNMTSLRRHFLHNFLTDLSAVLEGASS